MSEEIGNGENGLSLISRYRSSIMGFAALWIYVFHTWILITGPDRGSPLSFLYPVEFFVKHTGYLGVDIFLFLSGIGLTYSIKKDTTLKFYYRRIKRVILPFWVLGPFYDLLLGSGFGKIIKDLSCYNFFFNDINSMFWFIPAILTLYLFFPLYYRFFIRAKSKLAFTSGALLIWLLFTLIVRQKMRVDLFGFTNRIPVFIVGIIIGYIAQNKKDIIFTRKTYITLILMFVAGNYLAYLLNYTDFDMKIPVSNCLLPGFLTGISLTFLLARLFYSIEKRLSKIGKRIIGFFKFFGMMSLEFYCVGKCFSAMSIFFIEDGWSAHRINIFLFAFVTTLSFVAYYMFKSVWSLVDKLKTRAK